MELLNSGAGGGKIMGKQLDRILLDRLIGASTATGKAAAGRSTISRRAFMSGTLIGVAAAKAYAFPFSSHPLLRWRGTALTVALGRLSWTIDGSAFGPAARLSARPVADGYLIQLRRALLPGTRISVDFTCKFVRSGPQWLARLEMPGFRIQRDMALENWLRGEMIKAPLLALRTQIGKSELRLGNGGIAISSANGLSVDLIAPVLLNGPCDCTAAGVALYPAPSELLPDDSPRGWSTQVSFVTPRLRARGYACGSGDIHAIACPIETKNLEGEVFIRADGSLAQAMLAKGSARLDLRRKGRVVAPVLFDDAVVLIAARTLGIAGHLAAKPFTIGTKWWLASLTGDLEQPFQAIFEAGRTPQFAATVRPTEFRLLVPGADAAVLAVPAPPMVLATNSGSPALRPAPVVPTLPVPKNQMILDQLPKLTVGLDGARMSIRSGANLLNLDFEFEGFEIVEAPKGMKLKRRLTPGGKCMAGRIRVILPPQHNSETLQRYEGEVCAVPDPKRPMAQRYSLPSRIVFTLEEQPPLQTTGTSLCGT